MADRYIELGSAHLTRDVPDPDTSIRNPVKFRHPSLSGVRVKFAGYLPDSTVTYFITTSNEKVCRGLKIMFFVVKYCIKHIGLVKNVVFLINNCLGAMTTWLLSGIR